MEIINKLYNSDKVNITLFLFIIFVFILILHTSYNVNTIYAPIKTENMINQPTTIISTSTQNINKLVLYYADWCGWSKKFLPIWEQLNSNCASLFPNLIMEKIECTDNKNICENIPGYP